MRYPDISFFNEGIDMNSIVNSLDLICRCVSQIVVEEEVYNKDDMSDQEIASWVESLTTSQFQKIIQFFHTMPKLSHTVKLKNKKSGEDFSVTLEGLSDFF